MHSPCGHDPDQEKNGTILLGSRVNPRARQIQRDLSLKPQPRSKLLGRSRGGREGLTTRDSWRDLGAPAASNLARGQEDGDRDRVLGRRRQAASRLARLLGVSSRSSRESINNALGEDQAPAGQPDFRPTGQTRGNPFFSSHFSLQLVSVHVQRTYNYWLHFK